MAEEAGGGGRVCGDEVFAALKEVGVVVELGPVLGEFGGRRDGVGGKHSVVASGNKERSCKRKRKEGGGRI